MRASQVRGIRGATCVEDNSSASILAATRDLLLEILERNSVQQEDIASIFFTVTKDLDAAFPARAARDTGLDQVPLMCSTEIPVPGALPRCVRILMLVNTTKSQHELCHVYLKGAQCLRPDLT